MRKVAVVGVGQTKFSGAQVHPLVVYGGLVLVKVNYQVTDNENRLQTVVAIGTQASRTPQRRAYAGG